MVRLVLLEIFSKLTTYMMFGIVVIVVVAQFNRLLGSLLAILFWLAVAVVGYAGYEAGHSVGFPGLQLSLWQFILLCVVMAAVQGFGIYQAIVRNRNRAAYRAALDESDD